MPKDEWLKAKNRDIANRAKYDKAARRNSQPKKRRLPGSGRPGRVRNIVMPFGLHKGKELKMVPLGYLSWLLGLADLDANLRGHIERYLISRQSRIASKCGHEVKLPVHPQS